MESVSGSLDELLLSNYNIYKEKKLTHRRFKSKDIYQLIEDAKSYELFEISLAGKSIEGRDIHVIKVGEGEKKILLWTQMHGNEPTATMALFDILNFFKSYDSINDIRKNILTQCTLYFIPVLNPDGMDANKRRNAVDADLNRDSIRMAFPETQILWDIMKRIKPHYAFNMHDQRPFYNVGKTSKPAAISFLAPAYDQNNSVNGSRQKAMQLIAAINQALQKYIPGQTGEYSHEFYPTAVGDNIQKEGVSTILVESGWIKNDPEKQEVRKWNFMLLLYGFYSISKGSYLNYEVDDYYAIPQNGKLLYDLLIRNASIEHNGKLFSVDLGINRYERNILDNTDYFLTGIIEDIGDLSDYYGYDELDAGKLIIQKGKVYDQVPEDMENAAKLNEHELLSKGITTVMVKNYDKDKIDKNFNLSIENINDSKNENPLSYGANANFSILKDGVIKYAVVNGKLIEV